MRRPTSPVVPRSFAATCTAPRPSAPVPPRVVTAAPTPQYRRHHDVVAPRVDSTAFRQSWKPAESTAKPGTALRNGAAGPS